MVFVIFLVVAAVMLAALAATFWSAGTCNGNLLLGVTLPLDRLRDGEVLAVVERYRRGTLLAAGGFLLGMVPLILLRDYDSFSLLYLTLWFTGAMAVFQGVFNRRSRELSGLKGCRGWLTGERHMVTVDLEVARLRDTLPPSRLWFLPALLLNLLPLWVRAVRGDRGVELLEAILQGLLPLLALYGLFHWFAGARSVTVSASGEVNLALNRCFKRTWGGAFLGIAYLHGLCWCVIAAAPRLLWVLPATLAAECLGAVAVLAWALGRVRRQKNQLLALEREPVLADEDEFWNCGTYCNPADPRLMVEKRVGYGMTVNTARPLGKVLTLLPLAALALVLGLSVFLMQFDFGEVRVQVEGDRVRISAPLTEYEFSKGEIQGVELLEELPARSKISGYDGARLHLGAFRVQDYGRCQVFVHLKVPPFLAVSLGDTTVFVNQGTPEKTAALRRALEEVGK